MADLRHRVAVIIEPAPKELGALCRALEARQWSVRFLPSCEAAASLAPTAACSLVVIGPNSDGCRGFERARREGRWWAQLPIILITPHSSEAEAILALRLEVKDYFTRPVDVGEFLRAADRCTRVTAGVNQEPDADGAPQLCGRSAAIHWVRRQVVQAAGCSSTVLITGETGTGKELVARMLHHQSRRKSHALVCLNCAAIPDGLLESELFGHERGAFTNAHSRREGKFQQANHGTILFDEVGEMTLCGQSKLLRVLEDQCVYRVGGSDAVPIDVRVVAATNQRIEEAVQHKLFRSDLFYRLNVVRIHIPPLRERREDLPALVDLFLKTFGARFGRTVRSLKPGAMELLMQYDWPGNVRELRNVIEATFVNMPPVVVNTPDLPDHVRRTLEARSSALPGERERLVNTLVSTNWNKSQAAERLRCSRMTVYRKMRKYAIQEDEASIA